VSNRENSFSQKLDDNILYHGASLFSIMITLKIPHLLRYLNFFVTTTYAKYISFLKNLAPCIWSILSGILFQDFLRCNQL